MATSAANVATPHASKYLQQLCKHWRHKFEVDFTPERGRIDFGGPVCTLIAAPEGLDIQITAPPEEMDRWERVVANHIDRFAFREGALEYDWRRE